MIDYFLRLLNGGTSTTGLFYKLGTGRIVEVVFFASQIFVNSGARHNPHNPFRSDLGFI